MADDLLKLFERGRRRGRDPINNGADGEALTTADSVWLADFCEACGHTFRQGDRVFVRYGPPLLVLHHSPALPCSERIEAASESDVDELVQSFHRSLDNANPPPAGMHTERLLPGHPLLVPVRPRLHCSFCSKTFRPYEMAVICPCSPEDPKCRRGVHRDPGHGNDCHDAWIANGPLARCPTTFKQVVSRDATVQ